MHEKKENIKIRLLPKIVREAIESVFCEKLITLRRWPTNRTN